MRDNSPAAFWVSFAPAIVTFAAWATPVIFCAISVLPFAASATLRLISLVVLWRKASLKCWAKAWYQTIRPVPVA